MKRTKEIGEEEKRQGAWTCPLCGEENPVDEDVCTGCGSLREEPSYDQTVDVCDEK